MISAPVTVSRLPVGSSASSSAGLGHDRPGDGDALLLAARQLARSVVHSVGEADGVERVEGPSALLAAPPGR
jgi:hypothetical protein